MSLAFDARSLAGLPFAKVLTELAGPWSGKRGFTEMGRKGVDNWIGGGTLSPEQEEIEAERRANRVAIRARIAPVIAALKSGNVVLVDATGQVIPLAVWLFGRWTLYHDDDRASHWLGWVDANGHKFEFSDPTFAAPAPIVPPEKKPARRDPDAAAVKKGLALLHSGKAEKARSARQAAQMIYDGLSQAEQAG